MLSGLARRAVGERRGGHIALGGIAVYVVLVGANVAVVRAAIMSGVLISVAPDPRTVRPHPPLLARLPAAGLSRTDVAGRWSSSRRARSCGC